MSWCRLWSDLEGAAKSPARSMQKEAPLGRLAITQNVTVDGSIEMLLEELHRQDSEADGFLVGRRTFEDLRGYWPRQSDDATGITDYLNRVQKYVVSSTITDPQWENARHSGRFQRSCTPRSPEVTEKPVGDCR